MKKTSVFLLLFIAACADSKPATSNAGDARNAAGNPLGATGSGKTTLGSVQNAINENGAKWQAGMNPLAGATSAARAHRLGLKSKTSLQKARLANDNDTAQAASLPATFDWRDQNGIDFVSPILDQGACGSCVAFATIATLETQLNIAANDANSPFELSPQYLFSVGGAICANGWDPWDAASFLLNTGVPDNACMPYTSGADATDAVASSACSNAASRAQKITGFTMPTYGNASITAVKNALLHGPLVTTFEVYEDFFYYTSGVYQHVTGDDAGGHALSIIGWNDNDQAWIARNSWGADWGMNGFVEIAYADTSGLGQYTWALTVPASEPNVALRGVRDLTVMSGDESIGYDIQQLSPSNVSWWVNEMADSNQYTIGQGTASAGNNGYASELNTLALADGVYQLGASASEGALTINSEPHTVYILNGQETATIAAPALSAPAGAAGAAQAPVTGELQISVSVAATPVPLTNFLWTFNDANNNVLFSVNNDDPQPSMFLWDFDTTQVPNGNYSLVMWGQAGSQTTPATTFPIDIENPAVCTSNAQCATAAPVCITFANSNENFCAQCAADSDCQTGQKCIANACQGSSTN